MSECIVVTSGKGGVGKTTTAANIGTALALQGASVCVIDADLGLRNLDVILGMENRVIFDLVHVVEGKCRLSQALIRDPRNGDLCLLSASQTRDKNAVRPEQMRNLITELKLEFDFVIVDCPAGIEQGFRNAIAGADRAIVVTTPEVAAIRDADRIIGLVEAAELPEPHVLINRYRPAMVQRGDMLNCDDILEILAIPLIGLVPESEDIIISANRGEPVAYDSTSDVGEAYRRIARRLLGEEGVSYLHFEQDKGQGFWTSVKRWMGMTQAREAM